MRAVSKSVKSSTEKGYHFKKIVPIDVEDEKFLDHAVPFRFGFVRGGLSYDFSVPDMRLQVGEHLIHTYRDLDFQTGDKIFHNHKLYFVEDVSFNYAESTRNRRIKHYFMVIK